MKASNLFVVLVVVAVVIAGANMVVTFGKVGRLTGYANVGYANLTVEQFVSVNFTTDTVDWGSGVVDSGESAAFLDTLSGTVTDGNWTANSAGLVLENIGNVNVSLEMVAGQDAATFLGGTSPAYQWYFTNGEASSCTATSNISLGTFAEVNTTAITVCDPLEYLDARDELQIHLNLTVPYDSKTGALSDVITATATAA